MNYDQAALVDKLQQAGRETDKLLRLCTQKKIPILKPCREIYNTLATMPEAISFFVPVQELCTSVPGYRAIVKAPISFNEIRARLGMDPDGTINDNASYVAIEPFIFDLRLMVSNCYQFHGIGGNNYALQALRIEEKFETLFIDKLNHPPPVLNDSVIEDLQDVIRENQGAETALVQLIQDVLHACHPGLGRLQEIQINDNLPLVAKRAVCRFLESSKHSSVATSSPGGRATRVAAQKPPSKRRVPQARYEPIDEDHVAFHSVSPPGEHQANNSSCLEEVTDEYLQQDGEGEQNQILEQNKHNIPFHYVPSQIYADDEYEEVEEDYLDD